MALRVLRCLDPPDAASYKVKPIAKVLAEIREIRRHWPQPFIEFADDNTFVDRRQGKELVRALAPNGIKWFTETDISVADDPELLDLDARGRLLPRC